MARSIRAHQDLILNRRTAKREFACGVVEAVNRKIKLSVRKAYAFKTPEAAGIAPYHGLRGLPGPERAHEFC